MRYCALVLLFAILSSCTKEVTEKDFQKLNGYWEIEKVVFENGESKEYKVNETIDYFYITDKASFRHKVKPQFDGSYIEAANPEKIEFKVSDGKAVIVYKTPYATFQEEISEISETELVLVNNQQTQYHYKRPVPFTTK